ncbi:MAG: GntR family transcriptional regulator [Gemmiger sp.]|nr:GntR family transcriptional regulator [Gemmiger sp.]
MSQRHTIPPAARLGGELISAQVVEQLARELKTGSYAACTRLPAEVELAETLGVSRTVVRDALSELEREGYIERVRGIGTVLNRDVIALENRLDQKLEFYNMIKARGLAPRSDHLQLTRQKADDALAKSLDIAPGETVLWVCKRVLAGDTPVIYSTDVMPLSLFEGKRPEDLDFSAPVFEVLHAATGLQTTSTVAHLQAVVGDGAIRRLLGLNQEKALLRLEEICYSRLCRPVLHCFTYYTDFFDFSIVRKLLY